MKKTIHEKGIDCDFSEEDAFIYSITDEYASKIQKEADAYQTLGINGSLLTSIPFDIPIKNTLMMKGQAQFHPLKYLKQLVLDFVEGGGLIFEQTTATDVEEGDGKALHQKAIISCKYVVSGSHFPFFNGMGFILLECT